MKNSSVEQPSKQEIVQKSGGFFGRLKSSISSMIGRKTAEIVSVAQTADFKREIAIGQILYSIVDQNKIAKISIQSFDQDGLHIISGQGRKYPINMLYADQLEAKKSIISAKQNQLSLKKSSVKEKDQNSEIVSEVRCLTAGGQMESIKPNQALFLVNNDYAVSRIVVGAIDLQSKEIISLNHKRYLLSELYIDVDTAKEEVRSRIQIAKQNNQNVLQKDNIVSGSQKPAIKEQNKSPNSAVMQKPKIINTQKGRQNSDIIKQPVQENYRGYGEIGNKIMAQLEAINSSQKLVLTINDGNDFEMIFQITAKEVNSSTGLLDKISGSFLSNNQEIPIAFSFQPHEQGLIFYSKGYGTGLLVKKIA